VKLHNLHETSWLLTSYNREISSARSKHTEKGNVPRTNESKHNENNTITVPDTDAEWPESGSHQFMLEKRGVAKISPTRLGDVAPVAIDEMKGHCGPLIYSIYQYPLIN